MILTRLGNIVSTDGAHDRVQWCNWFFRRHKLKRIIVQVYRPLWIYRLLQNALDCANSRQQFHKFSGVGHCRRRYRDLSPEGGDSEKDPHQVQGLGSPVSLVCGVAGLPVLGFFPKLGRSHVL